MKAKPWITPKRSLGGDPVQEWKEALGGLGWPTSPDSIQALDRMKRAWGQRVWRKKQKRKGLTYHTFALNKDAKDALKNLKTELKLPTDDLVRKLIIGANEPLEERLRELKEARANVGNPSQMAFLRRDQKKLQHESDGLKKELQIQWERIESLTRLRCEDQIRLKAHGLENVPLSTDQELEAKTTTSGLLESYKEHIKARVSELKALGSKLE